MIELRAHHLLCHFGWRGQGYNQAFIDNFNDLKNRLDDEAQVKLVAGADVICEACPNLEGGDCRAPEYNEGRMAGSIDARVLERLGLHTGDTYLYGQLMELVRERIEPRDLSGICRGCAWLSHGWCADGLTVAVSRDRPI